MPARRDLMTGRLGFMHRSWGPLEPYDDAFPQILRDNGIYSHLATDHYHYFEDGGATYHNRYHSYDFIRGQEFDHWVGVVEPDHKKIAEQFHPLQVDTSHDGVRLQGTINRERITEEADFPTVKTMDAALTFIHRNKGADNWLLQIETFDPHEPFRAPERLQQKFPTRYNGPILDWPRYAPNTLESEETEQLQANYAALVTFCDEQLGRLLDCFDALNLWNDTTLILTTDHGFLLGEHDWWGKNQMPFYNEIANIPLILCHPEHAQMAGTRNASLTQTPDIMPTLLELHDASIPSDVTAHSILPLVKGTAEKIRDYAVYGIYAGAVNITDGQYSYFRYPKNMEVTGLYEYTLMPTHNYSRFEPRELAQAELHPPYDFTKGVPVLKIPALPDAKRSPRQGGFSDCETILFDFVADPAQSTPINAPDVEQLFCNAIAREMRTHDAPRELYARWAIQA